MAQKKLTTSVFGRTAKLVGSATKIARSELGHRFQSRFKQRVDDLSKELSNQFPHRVVQAKELVKTLGELKGAAMKAGQMLALEGQDFLPPEVLKVFTALQNQVPGMEKELIHERLKSQLGNERFAKLEDLSDEPIAAASMGQVHSASMGGEEVVLKIQYPGISKSIKSDMRVLESLAQNFVYLSGKKAKLSGLFEEMTTVLTMEADYLREREQQQFFFDKLKNTNGIIVPKVYSEFCAKEVLTTERFYAPSLQEWLDSWPSEEEKIIVGKRILELYCLEFFEWGRVQTDPNLGNFLIGADQELILLDFGATLEYDNEFREQYREILMASASEDRSNLLKVAEKLELLSPKETDKAKDAFIEMLKISIAPFDKNNQPFVFHDLDYAKRARDAAWEFSRLCKYTPPPQKLIFLHRKLGGIFNILKKMQVSLDLTPYWTKMVEKRALSGS